MPELSENVMVNPERPVFYVNDQPVASLTDQVRFLRVEERLDGYYRCAARFSNWGSVDGEPGYLYFGLDILNFGDRLRVEIGSGKAGGEVFQGSIHALEAIYPPDSPPEIAVIAEGDLFTMRMTRRTRTFESVTDVDVIRQIAGEHGLQAEVSLPGPTHAVLAQVDLSDLAYVRMLARRNGGELRVTGQKLVATNREHQGGDPLGLSLGAGLLAMRMRADLVEQRTEVAVSGWDPAAKQAILAEADAGAIASELDGDLGGSEILEQAFGPRREQVVREMPLSPGEAQTLAEADYLERARRFVTGTGVARGDARLRAGAWVSLRGLGELFDGPGYVVHTIHTFDPLDGYRTAFSVERPGIGAGLLDAADRHREGKTKREVIPSRRRSGKKSPITGLPR